MSELTEKKAEKIRQILIEEHNALIRGDLAKIAGILERKANLIQDLRKSDPNTLSDAQSLKEMTLRNQELLDKAMLGIRAVQDRIASLEHVRNNLDTYNKRGELQRVQSSAPSVERRA